MKPIKHFVITFLAVWLGVVAATVTCYGCWSLMESEAIDESSFKGIGGFAVMLVILVGIGVMMATGDKSPAEEGADAAADSSDPPAIK